MDRCTYPINTLPVNRCRVSAAHSRGPTCLALQTNGPPRSRAGDGGWCGKAWLKPRCYGCSCLTSGDKQTLWTLTSALRPQPKRTLGGDGSSLQRLEGPVEASSVNPQAVEVDDA
ncbi:unnamed protein product [Lota lota]